MSAVAPLHLIRHPPQECGGSLGTRIGAENPVQESAAGICKNATLEIASGSKRSHFLNQLNVSIKNRLEPKNPCS
jgi:hypothetical protein